MRGAFELFNSEREGLGDGQDGATEIWKKYRKGVEHHQRAGLYDKTRKAFRFFEGDQWAGVESGGEALPQYNIIQPVVEHKTASVAMNGMAINYSPMEYGDYQEAARACEVLNRYAARQWELLKMDMQGWAVIKEACIAGDSYLYFYDRDLRAQVIDNTNIYFGDETSADIQGQPWIIIAERRFVKDVRREAKANGVPQEQIELIGPDQDTGQLLGDDARKDSGLEDQRCTSLLYMAKNEAGVVSISRSVRDVVYQPDTLLQARDGRSGGYTGRGLTLYPVAGLVWIPRKNSARGVGEVGPLIPNQIEINKMLVRRLMNAKITAFGRMVYNSATVSNPESITQVGSAIEVRDVAAARVTDHVAYLHPSPMSQDAKNLTDEMISQTRDLAGAGDAALGQINPEQASGAAIIAVRDQAALPLNEQIADYKQFCEDVASVWYAIWVAYNPMGMVVELGEPSDNNRVQGATTSTQQAAGPVPAQDFSMAGEIQGQPGLQQGVMGTPLRETIPAEVLQEMRVNIRIDVSPTSPYSKYAQEQALGTLFQAGAISFEEYVAALDENSSVPKAKLQEIIDKRQEQARQQAAIQAAMQQMQGQVQSLQGWQQQALGVMDQQQALLGQEIQPAL